LASCVSSRCFCAATSAAPSWDRTCTSCSVAFRSSALPHAQGAPRFTATGAGGGNTSHPPSPSRPQRICSGGVSKQPPPYPVWNPRSGANRLAAWTQSMLVHNHLYRK
jgi:hypothetical protein